MMTTLHTPEGRMEPSEMKFALMAAIENLKANGSTGEEWIQKMVDDGFDVSLAIDMVKQFTAFDGMVDAERYGEYVQKRIQAIEALEAFVTEKSPASV